MPNITTNHAITYTKFINKKALKKPVSEIPTSKTSFSLPLISLRKVAVFVRTGIRFCKPIVLKPTYSHFITKSYQCTAPCLTLTNYRPISPL